LVTRPNNGSAGEDQRGREDRYNILLQLIKNDRKIWPVRTPAMEKKIAFSAKEKFSFEIAGRQFDELYKEVLSNKRK
jgi:hypothetical protein